MITIVANPITGKLFTATSKEGWVKCQVQSKELNVNNGIMSLQKRTAFPLIQEEAANFMLENGLKDGSKLPINGKIVRKLTSEPQYVGQKKVVNPTTGEEMGYYQSYTFTTNVNAQDVDERTAVKSETKASANIPVGSAFMED